MRIAVVGWSRRKVGGAEAYLSEVIPELVRVGHSIAFFHERDGPSNREAIPLPEGVPSWCVSVLGADRALAALREWCPDLIYGHGLLSPDLEAETLKIAPAVFLAHGYYGTCISGAKTFKSPIVTPCSRRFGWQCLLHYYPHHCGGWSPVTMFNEYRRQSKRLKLLRGYKAILTMSEHMRSEYLRQGFAPDRVHNLWAQVSHEVARSGLAQELGPAHRVEPRSGQSLTREARGAEAATAPCWKLLFAGRMDLLKGGRTFLDALPEVRSSLGESLRVTFAGDGPDRSVWERKAALLQAQDQGLSIRFVGWLTDSQLSALLVDCDLLVLPSLWPEPFGLVGLRAGLHGVPVAAFAVGGISEWLTDGVNGYFAPGDPPTTAGLAQAIVKCLHDRSAYDGLRRGAMEVAQQLNMTIGLDALLQIFERVVRGKERSLD